MKRGFTLIELLIVVAIIGILAAVALPLLTRQGSLIGEMSDVHSYRGKSVERVDMNSTRCDNGYLFKGSEPVTKSGVAVKC